MSKSKETLPAFVDVNSLELAFVEVPLVDELLVHLQNFVVMLDFENIRLCVINVVSNDSKVVVIHLLVLVHLLKNQKIEFIINFMLHPFYFWNEEKSKNVESKENIILQWTAYHYMEYFLLKYLLHIIVNK